MSREATLDVALAWKDWLQWSNLDVRTHLEYECKNNRHASALDLLVLAATRTDPALAALPRDRVVNYVRGRLNEFGVDIEPARDRPNLSMPGSRSTGER